jgi:hypothetical protein
MRLYNTRRFEPKEGNSMTQRIWTAIAGCAVAAALVAVPSALAAYTSAKLEVTPTATGIAIRATGSPDDDPSASVRIFAPAGTQVTSNQAPGTVLGTIAVGARALDLGGADVTLEGQIRVAAPGQVSAIDQAACLQGATPLATWILALSAAGQNLPVPAFLVGTSVAQSALGPAYIQVCLRPPDVPAGTPGRQPLGAKAYRVEATVNGVFSAVPVGAWVAFWTPYTPNVGTVNIAGTVATPAAVAPGAVTVAAKRAGRGAVVSGRVTQAGQGRGGATATIFGGAKARALKRLGRVTVRANGAYSFRARTGTFFRVNVVATAGAAAALCTALGPALAPIPCINPTVNGFTVQSRAIRKR